MRTSSSRRLLIAGALAVLAGCATPDAPPQPQSVPDPRATPERRALKGAALVARLIPARVVERNGWAEDIHAAMLALQIEPSAEHICAAVAVTEQESGFQVDPPVPGLAAIARAELEKRRERAGFPKFMVEAALMRPSSDGRNYNQRLDAATTEGQLSELFEDFAGRVPLGRTLFADRNPVRTGGPMQVSIPFVQAHAAAHRYAYPISGSVRDEVFTRRGGVYFGIAHLLHYPAPYDDIRYRFADFNAGRYASRNAAFQKALSDLTAVPLELDGDLLRYDQGRALREPSQTELVARRLGRHLEMSAAEIRRDLELGQAAQFERSRLYLAIYTLAEGVNGKPLARAVVPSIVLETSKTPRKLTTERYAARVGERYRGCLARL